MDTFYTTFKEIVVCIYKEYLFGYRFYPNSINRFILDTDGHMTLF